MKKLSCTLVILLVLLSLTVCVAESSSEVFTFRNGITFGMTKSDVMSLEADPPTESDDKALLYAGVKAAGVNADVLYQFENDSLVSIATWFADKHSNDNDYISDFNQVDDALRIKYGEGVPFGYYHWKNSLFADDKEQYGLAISAGHLVVISSWVVGECEFSHVLYGDNYKISHMILYRDSTHEEVTDTDGI